MSAEGYIKVDTVKLDNDRADVKKLLDDLKTQRDALHTSVGAMNSMWEGEAYQTFSRQVDLDLKGLDNLIQELVTDIHDYEQKAVADYDQCESDVQSMIMGMGNGGVA